MSDEWTAAVLNYTNANGDKVPYYFIPPPPSLDDFSLAFPAPPSLSSRFVPAPPLSEENLVENDGVTCGVPRVLPAAESSFASPPRRLPLSAIEPNSLSKPVSSPLFVSPSRPGRPSPAGDSSVPWNSAGGWVDTSVEVDDEEWEEVVRAEKERAAGMVVEWKTEHKKVRMMQKRAACKKHRAAKKAEEEKKKKRTRDLEEEEENENEGRSEEKGRAKEKPKRKSGGSKVAK